MSWVSSPALFQWFREDHKLKHRMWTTIFWRSARSKNERWSLEHTIFFDEQQCRQQQYISRNESLSCSVNTSSRYDQVKLCIHLLCAVSSRAPKCCEKLQAYHQASAHYWNVHSLEQATTSNLFSVLNRSVVFPHRTTTSCTHNARCNQVVTTVVYKLAQRQ